MKIKMDIIDVNFNFTETTAKYNNRIKDFILNQIKTIIPRCINVGHINWWA